MIPDLLLFYAAHSPPVMKTRTLITGANQPESTIFAGKKMSCDGVAATQITKQKTQATHYTQLAQEHQGRIPMLKKVLYRQLFRRFLVDGYHVLITAPAFKFGAWVTRC
jgi:hypothetical protein